MLKDSTEADDIIVLSISGRLETSDVEQAMGRLDKALDLGGQVHIFVEVLDFHGMPFDAWLNDIGHGLQYLTRLKQFGRVAIVSDQKWLRAASRIESALLPFVRYEVYTPDQRDQALAWVKGEASSPRAESVRILANGDAEIFAFEIDGRVTREGVDALHDHLSQAARSGTGLKLLAIIKHYDGFEPGIFVEPKYLELKLSLLRDVSRYAIVGGPDWIERLIKLSKPLLRMELRHFPAGSEDAARAWLHRASEAD